jgi:MerR family mercuric resistance operon transcriptional regulator
MGTLTIGKLAKKANVNRETIRYYERRKLIPKPYRRESGYREYSEDMVRHIQFIKHAKELGFSLKEIHELLSLKLDSKTPCSEVKNRAEIKIADIEEKVKTLQSMKKALVKLTKACRGKGPVKECPILEALERR